jgi:hypothetical protein
MRHIFTHELSQLARGIESAFFRIERGTSLLRSALSGAIAGLAVLIVAWFFSEGELLLFGCLGSSAAAVVFAPTSKTNSLRTQIFAYLVAALASAVLYLVHARTHTPVAVQCGLAVGASVFLMRWWGAMHPAAVGSALAFVLYDRNLGELALLLVAIISVLILVKVFIYIYLEELEFRFFYKEFTRDYYGRELNVTLVPAAKR